jgi:folylpolyglutamate synthase/dihydropteroate synthase
MVAALRADEFDVVHACTAPSPRGVDGAEVARAARELGCDEVYVHDSVDGACRAALQSADADDAILAAGSIYVAGAARSALRKYAP